MNQQPALFAHFPRSYILKYAQISDIKKKINLITFAIWDQPSAISHNFFRWRSINEISEVWYGVNVRFMISI